METWPSNFDLIRGSSQNSNLALSLWHGNTSKILNLSKCRVVKDDDIVGRLFAVEVIPATNLERPLTKDCCCMMF